MNKQAAAEKLEKSVLDRVYGLLSLLPNNITHENEDVFITVCDRIVKITLDAFAEAKTLGCNDFFSGWRRLLAPFWRNGYGNWEYAYGNGFTWRQFLDYIIESNCNDVKINKDNNTPMIFFADKNKTDQFCIELGKED